MKIKTLKSKEEGANLKKITEYNGNYVLRTL